MPLTHITRGFMLLLLVVVTGCASQRPAVVDYDRTINFSGYQTFGFFPQQSAEADATENTAATGYEPLISQHFKAAIMQQMQALGYQYSAENPQLLVNFGTNVETRTDIESSPFRASVGYGFYGRSSFYMGFPIYGNDLEKRTYKYGTVSIDVIDAAQKRLIWEGRAEGKLTQKAMNNQQKAVFDAVALIYQRYPTRLQPTE